MGTRVRALRRHQRRHVPMVPIPDQAQYALGPRRGYVASIGLDEVFCSSELSSRGVLAR